MHSKGVYTFKQLAGMPLRMLQGIIDAVGKRFKLVKPELWIPQAKLAGVEDWDSFKALKKKISDDHRK